MREIKFRVWSNQLNKMVYPNERGWFDKCFIGKNQFIQSCQLSLAIEKNGKELEVMQYTGLKDKNGKEIYEGDIVKSDNGESIDKIVYKQGAFYVESLKGDLLDELLSDVETEVIGNIYEGNIYKLLGGSE
ncbi:YopX family protein [Aeribacillus composti]|uniref:YopX-like protein n=1 Tax=Anoxybacillus phage A403 TaxID=2099336 RepID=A0A2P1JTX4_9CAUD|nr:YopX-like protein [Anoxybacillus phage A403]AVO22597.1 YopX-like protein [Anoxybacillus phage A403]